MERIAMSQEERDHLDWLKRVKSGSMTQREAAQKMGVSDRWVRVLLKRMSKHGDAVVVHGLRGRRRIASFLRRRRDKRWRFSSSRIGTILGRRLPPSSWPSCTRSRWAKRPCEGG